MKRNIIAISMVMTILIASLTGCGKKNITVPELMESAALADYFRTAEIGNVGRNTLWTGAVVPTLTSMYWETSSEIQEIKVQVGEYVEAGQVVAVVNSESATDALDDVRKAINLENDMFTYNNNIYEFQHSEFEYRIKGAKELGNNADAARAQIDLKTLEENHRYDGLMHDFRIKQFSKELARQQKLVEDGTLIATVSGYVSNVKDLTAGTMAMAFEPVVTIADYNQSYVELDGYTVKQHTKNNIKYSRCYTKINNETFDLEEYKYTPDELVLMEQNDEDANFRMKFKSGGDKIEVGTVIPVYMQQEVVENVVMVGNDSIFEDEQGNYVYVKENGSKVLRRVEIGTVDKYNTEIISGVSEGEAVYYQTESIAPIDYEIVTAELSDFKAIKTSPQYVIDKYIYKSIYSKWEGLATAITFSDKAEIAQGQNICNITVDEGSAKLAELRNQMEQAKVDYDKTIKLYDDTIAENIKKINELNEKKEDVATESDAEEDPYLAEELALQNEQIKINKLIATSNYNFNRSAIQKIYTRLACNNDGSGHIILNAETEGIISRIAFPKGGNVKEGDRLYDIGIPSEKRVIFVSDNTLHLNQKVEVAYGESKKYQGTIVGISDKKKYIVKMDDMSLFDEDKNGTLSYSSLDMKNVIVLPQAAVYVEIVPSKTEGQSDDYRYYVWKQTEAGLGKQYIDVLQDTCNGEVYFCVMSGLNVGDQIVVRKEE